MNNVHVYQSTFTHESRLLRITKTIAEAKLFDRIQIIARHETGLAESETIDENRDVWRVRTKFVNRYTGIWKVFATIEWTLRILWGLRSTPISCVNCHSLVVLPVCVVLKWQHRCKLIYDTHELETETSTSRGIRKRIAKFVERNLIGCADEVIAVTDSIGKWYEQEYSLAAVTVVRNVPLRPRANIEKSPALRRKLGILDENPLFIYLGSLGYGRGVERLLSVFSGIPDKHIVFVGFGPLAEEVQRSAGQCANIHFHQAVPIDQIATVASGADVGLALLEYTSLNHYYCLGNKVFEYLQCGLPVVVSDFPEMGNIVSRYRCGWKVDPDDENAVASLISRIGVAELLEKSEAARQCRRELVWEHEEPRLLNVYSRLKMRA